MHSPVSDDRSLIDRIAAGEVGAFEEFVVRRRDLVRGLAYKLLGRSPDLEDVVQDVFAAAFTHLRKFRGEASIDTWLTRVTVNCCRSRIRRERLRRRWFGWLTTHAESSYEEDGETSEQRQAVQAAVFRLPEKWRTPITLRYFAGFSIEQIAEAMELRPGAVETRLSRARSKLKEMLERMKEGDDRV